MCTTARLYTTDPALPPRAGYYENHPSLGHRWVTNRRLDAQRLQQAEAQAQEQWRDHEWARVLLTSDGIRINPPNSPDTWLPFDHALLTNVTAEPDPPGTRAVIQRVRPATSHRSGGAVVGSGAGTIH